MARAQRSDAVRNRQRLVDAATEAFTTTGVATPLEAVAAKAGVSIGTLYNHFGDRNGLVEAAISEAFAQLCAVADTAAGRADPWEAFETLIVDTCALQAADRAVADILGNQYPATGAVHEACSHLMDRFVEITDRAKASGQLRSDFDIDDLGPILWSNARIIEAAGPDAPDTWRRHLTLVLDGLRRQPAGYVAGKRATEATAVRASRSHNSPGTALHEVDS